MSFKQFFSLPSLSLRRPILGLLTALLISFLVAGCESGSDGSFIATPGESGNNNAGTGSVTFSFVQAQSAITVPLGTTDLRFDFFTDLAGAGSLVLRADRAYAGTVTIDGVPTSARSVVVTAFDDDGFPVSEFVANVNVVDQGTSSVSAADGTTTPVTLTGIAANPVLLSLDLNGIVQLNVSAQFSNGDSVPLTGTVLGEVGFSSDQASTATVSATGVVSAVLAGETVVRVTFRGFEAAVPVTVQSGGTIPPLVTSLVASPDTFTQPPGTITDPIDLTATFSDLTTRDVGLAQGVVFTASNSGITFGSDNRITVGPGVPPGPASATFSFGGQVEQVTITVTSATLQSIALSPTSVSLPFGGFEQAFTVVGTFSDTTTANIAPGSVTFSDNSALFSVDANGLVVTAGSGTAGQGTLNASVAGVTAATATVNVGTITINSLTLNPSSLTLNPGQFANIGVTANLSNGSTADVTDFASLEITGTLGNTIVLNGDRIVAVTPGAVTLTYTIPGAGPGGADAVQTLDVTVNGLTIVSAKYFYAGNEIVNNQLNLPRGYVGVFEVEATFSNGVVRKLRADEYEVLDGGAAGSPPSDNADALQLFDENYTITPVAGRFIDGLPAPETVAGPDSRIGEVGELADDLNERGVRFATDDPTVLGSDQYRVVTRPTFRAVAADWVKYSIVGTAVGVGTGAGAEALIIDEEEEIPFRIAPFASKFFTVDITAFGSTLSRTVTVTVTDPPAMSFASSNFANYPESPNVAVGSAREYEVRVNFDPVEVDTGLPPFVQAQENFKLAEANVRLASDDDGPGQTADRRQLTHVPTEIGFLGLTAGIPADVEIANIFAEPLGGLATLPERTSPPVFEIDDPDTAEFVGSITDPESYTPGTYANLPNVFGPALTTSVTEDGGFNDVFVGPPRLGAETDPGPRSIGGEPNLGRASYGPSERLDITFEAVQNGGVGFEITVPTLFTVAPATAMQLEVGATQIFRTLVQFDQLGEIFDRSLDYKPLLIVDEMNPSAIGESSLSSGQLTVIGINAAAPNATVTAEDVTGAVITAIGTFTQDGVPNVPASNSVTIDVVPATP